MATEYKTWQIGDVKVTRVLEQEAPLPPEALIANIDPDRLKEHEAWLKPDFMNEEGQIVLSIHALVVESGGKTIVVDTCMGNDRPLPMEMGPLQTNFLEDLERSSFIEDFFPPAPPEGTESVVDEELYPPVVWAFPLSLELKSPEERQ